MTFPINGGGFFCPILSRPPRRGQAGFPLHTNGAANMVLTPEDLIVVRKAEGVLVETGIISAKLEETGVIEADLVETGVITAKLDETGTVEAELVETGIITAELKDC